MLRNSSVCVCVCAHAQQHTCTSSCSCAHEPTMRQLTASLHSLIAPTCHTRTATHNKHNANVQTDGQTDRQTNREREAYLNRHLLLTIDGLSWHNALCDQGILLASCNEDTCTQRTSASHCRASTVGSQFIVPIAQCTFHSIT